MFTPPDRTTEPEGQLSSAGPTDRAPFGGRPLVETPMAGPVGGRPVESGVSSGVSLASLALVQSSLTTTPNRSQHQLEILPLAGSLSTGTPGMSGVPWT